ncbi:MYB DNA binding protein (Tbf1) [Planoprotostelium fungivorum]|uniref:MYB DNA binding protein (Tbf1) n=1 Tax=Planoprotostelium fungivorum TaxID=1890364 RepID=A0A2P6NNA9_9EUKA|nr:MYB DNA binding protein (Tbf1) [Planoprotostelium fungivorum]
MSSSEEEPSIQEDPLSPHEEIKRLKEALSEMTKQCEDLRRAKIRSLEEEIIILNANLREQKSSNLEEISSLIIQFEKKQEIWEDERKLLLQAKYGDDEEPTDVADYFEYSEDDNENDHMYTRSPLILETSSQDAPIDDPKTSSTVANVDEESTTDASIPRKRGPSPKDNSNRLLISFIVVIQSVGHWTMSAVDLFCRESGVRKTDLLEMARQMNPKKGPPFTRKTKANQQKKQKEDRTANSWKKRNAPPKPHPNAPPQKRKRNQPNNKPHVQTYGHQLMHGEADQLPTHHTYHQNQPPHHQLQHYQQTPHHTEINERIQPQPTERFSQPIFNRDPRLNYNHHDHHDESASHYQPPTWKQSPPALS